MQVCLTTYGDCYLLYLCYFGVLVLCDPTVQVTIVADTTLVNYGEAIGNTNTESEITENYSDSSQNVETVHKADELGNIYTDNSDVISSQPDTLTDVTDQFEPYIDDYTFNSSTPSNVDQNVPMATDVPIVQSEYEAVQDKDVVEVENSTENNYLQDNEYLQSNYDMAQTEEMLNNEREREKKSKKELEEEEREKMQ